MYYAKSIIFGFILLLISLPAASQAQQSSGWTNPANRYDVNNDGYANPLDGLFILENLEDNGYHVLPAPTAGNAPPPYYDVDGNGAVATLDVLWIFDYLIQGPQTGLVKYSVVIKHLNGNPYLKDPAGRYVIPKGQEFIVEGYVDDLREANGTGGVFAAFADLTYDVDLMDWTGVFLENNDTYFPLFQSGVIDNANQLINEVGGLADDQPLEHHEDPARPLFSVKGKIKDSAPTGSIIKLQFDKPDAPDGLHDTLIYNIIRAIDPETEIVWGKQDLVVAEQSVREVSALVNFYRDNDGAPGELIVDDQVKVGETFYMEITGEDRRHIDNGGLIGMSLNISWSAAHLEEIDSPFDPVQIITPAFEMVHRGELDNSQGTITNLTAASNPSSGKGEEIGQFAAERFALLKFRADQAMSSMPIVISGHGPSHVLADNDDVPIVFESQALRIVE